MSFEKGREKTGGRQKGTPNKRTDVLAICEAKGLDVFASMVEIAKSEPDVGIRFSVLKELAQYIAPKRRQVEVETGEGGLDLNVHVDESLKQDLIEAIKCSQELQK